MRRCLCNPRPTFSRFSRTQTRGRQTDRLTDSQIQGIASPRYSIASRGKNSSLLSTVELVDDTHTTIDKSNSIRFVAQLFSTVDKIFIDSARRAVPLQQNFLSNKLASRFACRQIISAGYHLTIMLFHFFLQLA